MSPTTTNYDKPEAHIFRGTNFNLYKVRIQAKLRSKGQYNIVNGEETKNDEGDFDSNEDKAFDLLVNFLNDDNLAYVAHVTTDTWILDSACTDDVTGNKNIFDKLSRSGVVRLRLADSSVVELSQCGQLAIHLDNEHQLVRSTVRYSPGVSKNLLSLNMLFMDGFKITRWDAAGTTFIKDTMVLRFKPHNGLFILRPHEVEVNNACVVRKTKPKLQAARDGVVDGLHLTKSDSAQHYSCETCEVAKSWRMSYKNTRPTGGPITPPTYGSKVHYELFVDEASRYKWLFLLKSKSETFDNFKKFHVYSERQFGFQVNTIMTDNAKEYLRKDLEAYCAGLGIEQLYTNVRCLLQASGMDLQYWGEALSYVVYTENRSPTKELGGKTPYEVMYGRKPNIEHPRPFGCTGFAFIDKSKRSKLEPRATKCILIGYASQRKSYRLINCDSGEVFERRSVKFVEEISTDLSNDPTPAQELAINSPDDVDEPCPRPITFSVGAPAQAVVDDQPSLEAAQAHLPDIPLLAMPSPAPTAYDASDSDTSDSEVEQTPSTRSTKRRNHSRTSNQVQARSSGSRRLRTRDSLVNNATWVLVDLPPPNFAVPGMEHLVCKLLKVINGPQQAPRCWYLTLHEFLVSFSFERCIKEVCLYIKRVGDSMVLLTVYACDALKQRFEMTKLKSILGIQVEIKDKVVTMSQQGYVEQLLEKFNMVDSIPLSPSELKTLNLPYRELVVKQAQPKRVDDAQLAVPRAYIANAVRNLSKYPSCFYESHWKQAKRVLRYLKGTKSLCLKIDSTDQEGAFQVEAYCDADFANSCEDRKSISGFLVMFLDCCLSAGSRMQSMVTLSTAEAEYIALCDLVKELLWYIELLEELGFPQGSIVVHCDNQSAIAIAKNPGHHERTKHIRPLCA
ncbi:Aste57867_18977 [Aphanomyces stellatus]|uniref:Aste57867_18977 protein n=1 Tax=Aphanomyces stellatus TaxID=120398 RepID=A0A485LFQ1_9STRA|nr:hypothetical protein As57867_018913 [Aphanomyces stellatus]VFT95705.1 Aste57867_18977 [Aphanomyces stellatus]